MNNVQFYILIGTTLGGVLWQRIDSKDLRDEIKDLRKEMNERFSAINQRLLVIEADLRAFYSITGRHDKAIEILERKL